MRLLFKETKQETVCDDDAFENLVKISRTQIESWFTLYLFDSIKSIKDIFRGYILNKNATLSLPEIYTHVNIQV